MPDQNCLVCGEAISAETPICPHCQSNIQQAHLIAELTTRVERLEAALATKRPRPTTRPEPVIIVPDEPAPEPDRFDWNELLSGEFWFNKIGIGLTILALAFLFRLAVERGWITPTVRVGIGLLIGTLLLGLGVWLRRNRPKLASVLAGGGIATYYITGFAAYQLFELVPFAVAFAYMSGVTILAFLLALRQNDAWLSLVGAIGGMITPFLLPTEVESIVGFATYMCILLIGIFAIYMIRGWKILQWVTAFGSWLIFFIGWAELPIDPPRTELWAVQLWLLCIWLLVWGVPNLRAILQLQQPEQLPPTRLGIFTERVLNPITLDLHFATIVTIVIAYFFTAGILWDFETDDSAVLAGGIVIVFSGLSVLLSRNNTLKRIRDTHILVTFLFTVIATIFYLGDASDGLIFALLVQLAVFSLLAIRYLERWVDVAIHLFALILLGVLYDRIGDQYTNPFLNRQALVNLFGIGVFVGVGVIGRIAAERIPYLLAAHALFLYWIWIAVGAFDNGQAFITICWGIYALALLIWGLRRNQTLVRQTALATLLLVVGKLFAVDLAQVDAVVRILLFFGFGGFFLLLSYFYPTLWRTDSEPEITHAPDNE